jgi:transcriptional regulator with XRE-family HTH domain
MTKQLELDRAPNPIDRHVGLRIRLRRKELGVSQERLADSIGLTFQQVQKYERAANRVSASKLWEMARVLKTSIAYFYEGLGDPSATEPVQKANDRQSVQDFLLTPEGLELASAFPRIKRARVRRRILELARALAEDEEGEES